MDLANVEWQNLHPNVNVLDVKTDVDGSYGTELRILAVVFYETTN